MIRPRGDAVFAVPEAGSCLHGAEISIARGFAIAAAPMAIGGADECLECAYREALAAFGAGVEIRIAPTPAGVRVSIGRRSATAISAAAALRELTEISLGA